jgi:hypothetical protein
MAGMNLKTNPPKRTSRNATSRRINGSSATTSDYPEFIVSREHFNRYFEKPLPTSTFHDLVTKGIIISFTDMRGHYQLNASLRRLGLPEVRELPKEVAGRSLEDVVRLAFTLIDRDLFPEPSWLLFAEAIDLNDVEHARRIADHHRGKVTSHDHVNLKLAYFQGVLDATAKMEAERNSRSG